MTDDTATAAPANSAFRVLAAIADLGEATAAAIADEAGLGYSTVTPKLRAWEAAGQAEKYYNQDKSQTLWRLTGAGKTATATSAHHTATPGTEGGATARSATAKPTKGKDKATAAAEPDRPAGQDEPNTAEPIHHDDDAAPTISPETTDPATDETAPATDTSGPATPAADPPPTAAPADDQPFPAAGDTTTATDAAGTPAKRRRPKGAVEASALAILQANPGTEYKVGEMTAAIDDADAGTGYPKVSEGATTNALNKLAHQNKAVRVEGRNAATYTLAPTTD